MSEHSVMDDWILEGSVDGTRLPTRFSLKSFPLRIGRQADLEIVLPVAHVSGLHAEIFEDRDRLWVRDLGSSNGTRLNQERLERPAPLSDGDILHFADLEFVLEHASPVEASVMATRMMPAASDLLVQGARSQAAALRQLIAENKASAVFQPIVCLRSAEHHAFELLGRGSYDGLPSAPGPLFQIAEASGLAAELSALFRRVGVSAAATLGGAPRIFINAHPTEVSGGVLVNELHALRERFPELPLALEVHETTVTDPISMRALRSDLALMDIPLAFDDFGAGQARLLELAESPPDYLKFDMSLLRDIHLAPASRQSMVEHLVGLVKEMGVRCLAEGIECEQELRVCTQMGFDYAQGYLLGRPQSAEFWRDADAVTAIRLTG